MSPELSHDRCIDPGPSGFSSDLAKLVAAFECVGSLEARGCGDRCGQAPTSSRQDAGYFAAAASGVSCSVESGTMSATSRASV